MDIAVRKLFENVTNINLENIVISNSVDRKTILKVKIRPILMKNKLYFQASEFIGQKVIHKNYTREELLEHLPVWFDHIFRQAEIVTKKGRATVLISKKGKTTIIKKPAGVNFDTSGDLDYQLQKLVHNKKKNYILEEGAPIPFLVDLGVMNKDGMINKSKSDKFRQINRFLEFIEDILPYLERNREITILDFGCGKSYLTFALYYYLKIQKNYHIKVIGLDLKSDVIDHCNLLSEKYGYDQLKFLVGDIASYTGTDKVDMVVSLHACDTATDYALFKAVSWKAKVILSVPCCQHELNRQLDNNKLKPVLKHGIIKERMAALITDAMRAEVLESKGYKVQLLEFIDMEHTPKNILIRAVKKEQKCFEGKESEELKECMELLGVNPCLYRLFQEEDQ